MVIFSALFFSFFFFCGQISMTIHCQIDLLSSKSFPKSDQYMAVKVRFFFLSSSSPTSLLSSMEALKSTAIPIFRSYPVSFSTKSLKPINVSIKPPPRTLIFDQKSLGIPEPPLLKLTLSCLIWPTMAHWFWLTRRDLGLFRPGGPNLWSPKQYGWSELRIFLPNRLRMSSELSEQ